MAPVSQKGTNAKYVKRRPASYLYEKFKGSDRYIFTYHSETKVKA